MALTKSMNMRHNHKNGNQLLQSGFLAQEQVRESQVRIRRSMHGKIENNFKHFQNNKIPIPTFMNPRFLNHQCPTQSPI